MDGPVDFFPVFLRHRYAVLLKYSRKMSNVAAHESLARVIYLRNPVTLPDEIRIMIPTIKAIQFSSLHRMIVDNDEQLDMKKAVL
jgi:hypothetical protein